MVLREFKVNIDKRANANIKQLVIYKQESGKLEKTTHGIIAVMCFEQVTFTVAFSNDFHGFISQKRLLEQVKRDMTQPDYSVCICTCVCVNAFVCLWSKQHSYFILICAAL